MRSVPVFDKATTDAMLESMEWREFNKRVTTKAMRIAGPFTVDTREGTLPCEDGWLAIDAHGWPYPIAADEFDAIYEEAT